LHISVNALASRGRRRMVRIMSPALAAAAGNDP
jgi:hypothetical protein